MGVLDPEFPDIGAVHDVEPNETDEKGHLDPERGEGSLEEFDRLASSVGLHHVACGLAGLVLDLLGEFDVRLHHAAGPGANQGTSLSRAGAASSW